MRYVVDLVRGLFYAGTPEYGHIGLQSPAVGLAILEDEAGLPAAGVGRDDLAPPMSRTLGSR